MYQTKKRVFTVLFLSILMGYSVVNAVQALPQIQSTLASAAGSPISQLVQTAESSVTDALLGKMNFIEFYAYLQRLLDKREINNFAYIKDENGFLHYSSFFREADPDVISYALRVRRLQDYVEKYGTKVLCVTAPSKYITGQVPLREGLSANDPSILIEQTLLYLNRLGVETLNLGEYLPNKDLSYEETYFRTDHHWTIPAAFEATKVLVKTMQERFDAPLDDSWLASSRYTKVTYHKGMLGSMGRKTGVNFVGLEDFTALWPQFEMHYSRDCLEEKGVMTHREGLTEDTLMIPETLLKNDSIYKDSLYSLYLNSLRSYETITNEDNPDGPSVLMIRDSYFSPVITFMAPMCSRIDAIWSLETSDQIDIEQYVKENRFDYIIVEMYPYNIEDDAFNFFREDVS